MSSRDHITVIYELVNHLLANPKLKGLIHGEIMEVGRVVVVYIEKSLGS